jgi:hypothetical protein
LNVARCENPEFIVLIIIISYDLVTTTTFSHYCTSKIAGLRCFLQYFLYRQKNYEYIDKCDVLQEWRHSHGMRCLGIPNTAHFANITKIADAIELWQKIREQKDVMRWRPEVDEEYEDSAGNVVNRRTFEDLKRQGLL